MRLCGIIKPHALKHSQEILQVLRDASLIIIEIKSILYTYALVETLYDHMSSEARSIIGQKLVDHQGMAVIGQERREDVIDGRAFVGGKDIGFARMVETTR